MLIEYFDAIARKKWGGRSFFSPAPGRAPSAVRPEARPATECLADVVDRLIPYWEDVIVAEHLRAGRTVLVAAHGNSLRALVKHLDGISDDDIAALNIPTGIPLVYELDAELKPLKSYYLADEEAVRKAAEAVANQGKAK